MDSYGCVLYERTRRCQPYSGKMKCENSVLIHEGIIGCVMILVWNVYVPLIGCISHLATITPMSAVYGLAALADCSSNDNGVDTYTLATSCLYGTSELTKALHIYFLQHAYIAVDFIVAYGAYQNTKYRRIMCANMFHLMQ